MGINLNDSSFDTTPKIFNNGEAGIAENVTISVQKKQPSDADNMPDYKLIATDEQEATVNEGFYYFKEQEGKDNERLKGFLLSRLVHIARAVMGKDYKLPEVKDVHEAMDVVFNLVRKNTGDKLFNVFVTYGTKDYPSQYLGLRYFNFIESADVKTSRFKAGNNDLMERINPDEGLEDQDNGLNLDEDSNDEWGV